MYRQVFCYANADNNMTVPAMEAIILLNLLGSSQLQHYDSKVVKKLNQRHRDVSPETFTDKSPAGASPADNSQGWLTTSFATDGGTGWTGTKEEETVGRNRCDADDELELVPRLIKTIQLPKLKEIPKIMYKHTEISNELLIEDYSDKEIALGYLGKKIHLELQEEGDEKSFLTA
ncbi:unnamed protein product [Haemonchus placei]|uniref:Ubiquitinyl hydrolase 1 n=1 Tax=Haemonchus placei TaxID=6290 RepID=A0A0N4WU00_HAEPC|nr:unnamed protein product [Haemonchus placei]